MNFGGLSLILSDTHTYVRGTKSKNPRQRAAQADGKPSKFSWTKIGILVNRSSSWGTTSKVKSGWSIRIPVYKGTGFSRQTEVRADFTLSPGSPGASALCFRLSAALAAFWHSSLFDRSVRDSRLRLAERLLILIDR